MQSTQFDLTALLQILFVNSQEQEREKRMIASISSNAREAVKLNLQLAGSYRKTELVVHKIMLLSPFYRLLRLSKTYISFTKPD